MRPHIISSNQEEEMDELVNSLIDQTQLKLKNDLLLREVFIPNAKAEAKCNIFISHNHATCPKLCVFIQSTTDLQPGIWSRKVHPKTGFQGSMLPYVKTAIQSGYGVVILNPGTNVALVHGHRAKILHSSTPSDHVFYVWKQYISIGAAQEISFIAHHTAGSLVVDLLSKIDCNDEKRIGGIAFIESSHTIPTTANEVLHRVLQHRAVNFQSSQSPVFTQLSRPKLICTTLSVGNPPDEHFAAEWTIHSVQTSTFVFLQAISMGLQEAIDAVRATFPNKLVVTINRARLTGQPYNNPFAIVQCVNQKKETAGHHKHTMDPEWNQTFSFPVTKSDETVVITVKDKVFPLSTISLGQTVLSVNQVGLNRTDRRWYALLDERDPGVRGHGEIELTLEWVRDTFVARSESLIRQKNSSSSLSPANENPDTPIVHNQESEDRSNACYLCRSHFVLLRKKYCRMCLRIVCASCSDRIFLPGFSEAKRVCTGCCDLQMMLHTRLPKMKKNVNGYASKSNATLNESTIKEAESQINAMRQRELQEQTEKPLSIDDFELLQVVGRGAFGKVLLVRKRRNKNANQIYAMKILVKSHIVKNDQIENTRAEQHILKVIEHPFIVRLRYAFQNAEKLYLIMDYYPGGSMFYHLRKSKRFTEERTRLYMAQLLTALMHLHEKRIAYRDLKLENILMDSNGNIALTDFGLSKEGQMMDGAIRASQSETGMKTICGTAEYMAPELLRHQPYSKVVDWWSYGILLFEMLTGKTPFVDRNRRQMFKNIMQAEIVYPSYITPVTRSLISKLLNRDPSKRLGSGLGGGKDIMSHPFYDSVDWDKLMRKEITPSFKPDVQGVDDITNVPEMFRNMAAIDSPVNVKSAGHHFDDFTFQDESRFLK